MYAKLAWSLTACLVLPICVGCGAGANVIRGQNPVDHIPTEMPAGAEVNQAAYELPQNASASGEIVPVGCNDGSCQSCQSGQCNGCPNCQFGACPNGMCDGFGGAYGNGYGGGLFAGHGNGLHGNHGPNCRCRACVGDQGCNGYGWYPNHHHTYEYKLPNNGNLQYPPANQPAAVVQYPYYTVKGPSDFFMK